MSSPFLTLKYFFYLFTVFKVTKNVEFIRKTDWNQDCLGKD